MCVAGQDDARGVRIAWTMVGTLLAVDAPPGGARREPAALGAMVLPVAQ